MLAAAGDREKELRRAALEEKVMRKATQLLEF
jgi:hypothetical protein